LTDKHIEIELKIFFRKNHIYYGAGNDFYNIDIIDKVEPFLVNNNYNFIKLTEEQINDLIKNNKKN
jgi:hypothetical protein